MADAKKSEDAPKSRRRAPRGQRRHLIVEGAAKIFSEKGFSASTREIASALGVTQALLYRYFKSKDALIDAVFEARYLQRDSMPESATLVDQSRPILERVTAFYCDMLESRDAESLRLFLYAALSGYSAPQVFVPVIQDHSIKPLIAALRAESGLPALQDRPLSQAEYDLAMAQHGNVVYTALRHHVYKITEQLPIEDAVRQLSRVWLRGASAEIKAIHEDWASQSPARL